MENRGGASGNIGAEAVAKSAADGYTLLVTAPPPLTTNAALYKSLPFDPATDFAPVALLATVPIVLMVHPSRAREERAGADRAGQGQARHAQFRLVRHRLDQSSGGRASEDA